MSDQEPKRIEPLRREDLPDRVWSASVAIRFGQCDAAGIVYTPNYFDIINGVIERFYGEALGIDYYALVRERRIGLGYAHASCEFLKPNSMGDHLDVAVLLDRIGRSSYTLLFPMVRERREVVRGRFVTVATALDTRGVIPIPDDIRDALTAYRARCGGRFDVTLGGKG